MKKQVLLTILLLPISAMAVDMRSYNDLVMPFLDKHCTNCHDDDDLKADPDLYAISC